VFAYAHNVHLYIYICTYIGEEIEEGNDELRRLREMTENNSECDSDDIKSLDGDYGGVYENDSGHDNGWRGVDMLVPPEEWSFSMDEAKRYTFVQNYCIYVQN
jgi:hypothetical protein